MKDMLERAVTAVKEQNLSQREASKLYKVPRATLQDRISGGRSEKLGRPRVLSDVEENMIVERVKVKKIGKTRSLITYFFSFL